MKTEKITHEKINYENDLSLSNIRAVENSFYVYPAHFHSNMEIIILNKGMVEVKINGKPYKLTDGDILVVDQYAIHEYTRSDPNDSCFLLIPERYLMEFNGFRKNYRIQCPVIHDEEMARNLAYLVHNFLVGNTKDESVAPYVINLITAMLGNKLVFVDSETERKDYILLKRILELISNDYKNPLSLQSISKKLCYSQEYVSRVFHKYFNYNIKDYINELRIEFVQSKLKKSDTSITNLIYDAGFNNPSTYYRQLAKIQARRQNN